MKLKNILTAIILSLAILSCSKEEPLVASNPNSSSDLKFPEGTPFDNITTSIYEKFGVKIYWSKNITNTKVNRTWTSASGAISFDYLNEQQAGETINFLNDHLFSKIDPVLFNKSLKPNIYLLYDANTPWAIFFNPVKLKTDGMDNWLISMFGEGAGKYIISPPSELHKVPSTNEEIHKFRRLVIFPFFVTLVNNKTIKVPEQFETEFDYTPRDLKYRAGDEFHPDFYMNQNFCGSTSDAGNLSYIWMTGNHPAPKNFLAYMALVCTYTRDEIKNGPAGIGDAKFKNYPKILYFYDIVDKYMIEKYNYDLKQLHSLK